MTGKPAFPQQSDPSEFRSIRIVISGVSQIRHSEVAGLTLELVRDALSIHDCGPNSSTMANTSSLWYNRSFDDFSQGRAH